MIGDVIDEIHNKVNTNVIVQVQSYGRVFVYDQIGEIVPQDEALCAYREDGETTDELMLRAVNLLKDKIV